ncbi:hypothetical protein PUN28_008010 [Cardiocondyla obscurior]|uniref:Uncharacterized protein n=1 Tax=Cardiocondyla obscurior TaxID=286306 RepID=A0AAW2FX59_9HYME
MRVYVRVDVNGTSAIESNLIICTRPLIRVTSNTELAVFRCAVFRSDLRSNESFKYYESYLQNLRKIQFFMFFFLIYIIKIQRANTAISSKIQIRVTNYPSRDSSFFFFSLSLFFSLLPYLPSLHQIRSQIESLPPFLFLQHVTHSKRIFSPSLSLPFYTSLSCLLPLKADLGKRENQSTILFFFFIYLLLNNSIRIILKIIFRITIKRPEETSLFQSCLVILHHRSFQILYNALIFFKFETTLYFFFFSCNSEFSLVRIISNQIIRLSFFARVFEIHVDINANESSSIRTPRSWRLYQSVVVRRSRIIEHRRGVARIHAIGSFSTRLVQFP